MTRTHTEDDIIRLKHGLFSVSLDAQDLDSGASLTTPTTLVSVEAPLAQIATDLLDLALAVAAEVPDLDTRFGLGAVAMTHALPLLGGKGVQAAMLRATAYAIEGNQAELAVMRDALSVTPPAPAPPAARPGYPQPADFAEAVVIGYIAGTAVIGRQGWETVDGSVLRYEVAAELGGVRVTADAEAVGIPNLDNGLGEIRLAALGTLIELKQAGLLDQLVSMASRWLAEPLPLPLGGLESLSVERLDAMEAYARERLAQLQAA